jgi:hypothetical protein
MNALLRCLTLVLTVHGYAMAMHGQIPARQLRANVIQWTWNNAALTQVIDQAMWINGLICSNTNVISLGIRYLREDYVATPLILACIKRLELEGWLPVPDVSVYRKAVIILCLHSHFRDQDYISRFFNDCSTDLRRMYYSQSSGFARSRSLENLRVLEKLRDFVP